MSSSKGSRGVRSILIAALMLGVVVATQVPAAWSSPGGGRGPNLNAPGQSGQTPSQGAPAPGQNPSFTTRGKCYLAINDVAVGEGSGPAVFAVSLSSVCAKTVTVQHATQDGTAGAGSDYTASSGTLTFAPGELSKSISVGIINDSTPETNETFSVQLSNARNAGIVDATGVATITDDDPREICSPWPQCIL